VSIELMTSDHFLINSIVKQDTQHIKIKLISMRVIRHVRTMLAHFVAGVVAMQYNLEGTCSQQTETFKIMRKLNIVMGS
jgi:hypothetical protein